LPRTGLLARVGKPPPPRWTATVDGREVPIYLAANALKAIEVPAGNHEVVFTYSSRWMWIGLTVSGTTLLLCGWRLRRPTAATGSLDS
jgi:uncharacterized membrane protein YfhO